MTSRPLADLLVVALEQAVAAPLASCRLADGGARVIKIERPAGDFARTYDTLAAGESAYFVWLNRGKESVVLDIKDPADAALLHRIIARADVFLQNLAPGAAARAGFGSGELRARHPALITCDISGYGAEGPYRHMKAYDLLVQAESGLAAITGRPEGPGRVGVSVCDIAAGMAAHAAILEALLARQRTGEGRALQISLFHTMADWMAVPLLQHEYGGRDWPRVGLAHPSIAPYGAYPLHDGTEVLIGVQNDAEFERLTTQVLGRPELAGDPRFRTNVDRVRHRAELDAEIDRVFARHDRHALAGKLEAAGIAYGFVNSLEDLARHPQLHRATVPTPSGEVRLPPPPTLAAGTERRLDPVPALGEHSTAIREEFVAEESCPRP